MKRNTALKLVASRPPERIYGSDRFIGLTRNVGLESPSKFVPLEKPVGTFEFVLGKLVEVR
jgi:hypothetical protein